MVSHEPDDFRLDIEDFQNVDLSSISDQPCRLGHPQSERLNDFENTGKAGTLVFRRLIALDLLFLQSKPLCQCFLT